MTGTESADGNALVFVHGFMGKRSDWDGVREALHDFDTAAITLPGHEGLPLRSGALSMDAWADRLADQIKALYTTPPHVVAYSLGGRVTLRMVARHPQRVAGVALLSTHPGLVDSSARELRAELDLQRAAKMQDDFPAFLERWYRAPLFGLSGAALREAVETRSRNDVASLARIIAELSPGVQPKGWELLRELRGALVVVGARDQSYRSLAVEMARASDGQLRVETLRGAGHDVHRAQPAALANVIRCWVRSRAKSGCHGASRPYTP